MKKGPLNTFLEPCVREGLFRIAHESCNIPVVHGDIDKGFKSESDIDISLLWATYVVNSKGDTIIRCGVPSQYMFHGAKRNLTAFLYFATGWGCRR